MHISILSKHSAQITNLVLAKQKSVELCLNQRILHPQPHTRSKSLWLLLWSKMKMKFPLNPSASQYLSYPAFITHQDSLETTLFTMVGQLELKTDTPHNTRKKSQESHESCIKINRELPLDSTKQACHGNENKAVKSSLQIFDAVFNLLLRCGLDTWTPWLLHPVMIPTNFLQSSWH